VTMLWAVAPEAAYLKWDWAIKSIAFTVIIPHFINDRKSFEAFLWTILISGVAHCIAFGAKVFLSGGGYGVQLGLVGGNVGYGESSTLAMFSVSLIPVAIYLYFHQTLFPQRRLVKWFLGAFIFSLLLAGIGTYARTSVVCLAVFGLCFLYYSKRRMFGLMFIVVLAGLAYPFLDDDWFNRMSTIDSGTDSSAMGRVAVWKWVIEYIAVHPLGGGFDMYRINSYSMQLSNGSILQVSSKAFHSIYFEVLGEGGVPGFIIFMILVAVTLGGFMRHKKILASTGEKWLGDAGRYLLISTIVYLAGGAFIGVAFQSYFYYLAALSAAYINIGVKYARP